jgi:hypothetical protein
LDAALLGPVVIAFGIGLSAGITIAGIAFAVGLKVGKLEWRSGKTEGRPEAQNQGIQQIIMGDQVVISSDSLPDGFRITRGPDDAASTKALSSPQKPESKD